MGTSLVLHRGARLVEPHVLKDVPVPPATQTWFPLSHDNVVNRVELTLQAAGFEVRTRQLALSRDDARFFGVLTLKCPLVTGVDLAVGISNSTDKSLPQKFCAGSRVFVCDNLAFTSQIEVSRRHTRFGQERFNEAIAKAVQSLSAFREAETARISRMASTAVPDIEALGLMTMAVERKILSPPRLLPLINEWRNPSHEEWRPRTLWSLCNACTFVLGPVLRANPQRFAAATIALQELLAKEVGIPSEAHLALSP